MDCKPIGTNIEVDKVQFHKFFCMYTDSSDITNDCYSHS